MEEAVNAPKLCVHAMKIKLPQLQDDNFRQSSEMCV